MNNKKYIKTFMNEKYFELPPSKFVSGIISKRFNFSTTKTIEYKSMLYLFNKTSNFDKFLITSAFELNFVFLKDFVVEKLYSNSLTKDEEQELKKSFKQLKSVNISVVMFPEKNCTIFGNFQKLPHIVTDFLANTKMNIQFFNIAGMFYAKPVWSLQKRKVQTKLNKVSSISEASLRNLSSDEINAKINDSTPSTASTYAKKFPIKILTNNRAEGLDRVVYCCPRCEKLFHVYSEFNCLKCSSCDSAIEISDDGSLLFSKTIENIDEFKDFQFKKLSRTIFGNGPIFEYNHVFFTTRILPKNSKFISGLNFQIYADKIVFSKNNFRNTIKIKDIEDIRFYPENVVIIKEKDGIEFVFQGKTHENFYIIYDLMKLNK